MDKQKPDVSCIQKRLVAKNTERERIMEARAIREIPSSYRIVSVTH